MNTVDNKLKLCFFINGFGGGGAEKQCAYLINELQKDENINISLVYFFEGVNFGLVNQSRIDIFKVPSQSLYSFKNIPLSKKIIGAIKPDIVFSWMQAPDVLSFFIKLKFPRIKWILAERTSRYSFRDFRYALRAITGRFADVIICNSAEGKLYWKKKFVSENKLTIAPNILYKPDISKLSKQPVITGAPIILFAGRLEDQKNVLVLAKAFCMLADKFKEGRFYIIGKGILKNAVEQIIEDNKKQTQVILMPFQNNIYDFFSAADVFVNISNYEGLPNTVIENIALNKKVVVSAITEHKNILGNNFSYYVNDHSKPEEVSAIIESALADKNFDVQLIYAKKMIGTMSPQNVVDLYKRIFYLVKNSTQKINFKSLKATEVV